MISRDTSVRTRNTVPFRNSIIHLVVPHYRPLALVEPVIRSNQSPVLKLSTVKQQHLHDQLIYQQPQQHNMLNKQHKLHKLLHWKKKSNNQCKFFFNISFFIEIFIEILIKILISNIEFKFKELQQIRKKRNITVMAIFGCTVGRSW